MIGLSVSRSVTTSVTIRLKSDRRVTTLLFTYLYHLFSVSIHSLQCIHCLLQLYVQYFYDNCTLAKMCFLLFSGVWKLSETALIRFHFKQFHIIYVIMLNPFIDGNTHKRIRNRLGWWSGLTTSFLLNFR